MFLQNYKIGQDLTRQHDSTEWKTKDCTFEGEVPACIKLHVNSFESPKFSTQGGAQVKVMSSPEVILHECLHKLLLPSAGAKTCYREDITIQMIKLSALLCSGSFLSCVASFPAAMFGVQTRQPHFSRQSAGSRLLHAALKASGRSFSLRPPFCSTCAIQSTIHTSIMRNRGHVRGIHVTFCPTCETWIC